MRFRTCAAAFLAAVATGTPPSASEGFLAARAKQESGDYEAALKLCERAIAGDPKDTAALMLGTDLCLGLGHPERALAMLDAHLAAPKPLHRAWFDRADCLVRLGRLEEAVPAYTRAIDVLAAAAPRSEWLPRLLQMRFAVRARLGEGAKARAEYRDAVDAIRKRDEIALRDSRTKLALGEMTEEEFREESAGSGEAHCDYHLNFAEMSAAEEEGDLDAAKRTARAIDAYGKFFQVSDEMLRTARCMASPSTRAEVALARLLLARPPEPQ